LIQVNICNANKGRGEAEGERRWKLGQEREMTQTMYAHVNKLIVKIK
jgi:hypothetical protein